MSETATKANRALERRLKWQN